MADHKTEELQDGHGGQYPQRFPSLNRLGLPLSQAISVTVRGTTSQIRQAVELLAHEPSTSLRAKKYDEANDIWQARVDDGYRFYFQIDGETYLLLSIISRSK